MGSSKYFIFRLPLIAGLALSPDPAMAKQSDPMLALLACMASNRQLSRNAQAPWEALDAQVLIEDGSQARAPYGLIFSEPGGIRSAWLFGPEGATRWTWELPPGAVGLPTGHSPALALGAGNPAAPRFGRAAYPGVVFASAKAAGPALSRELQSAAASRFQLPENTTLLPLTADEKLPNSPATRQLLVRLLTRTFETYVIRCKSECPQALRNASATANLKKDLARFRANLEARRAELERSFRRSLQLEGGTAPWDSWLQETYGPGTRLLADLREDGSTHLRFFVYGSDPGQRSRRRGLDPRAEDQSIPLDPKAPNVPGSLKEALHTAQAFADLQKVTFLEYQNGLQKAAEAQALLDLNPTRERFMEGLTDCRSSLGQDEEFTGFRKRLDDLLEQLRPPGIGSLPAPSGMPTGSGSARQ